MKECAQRGACACVDPAASRRTLALESLEKGGDATCCMNACSFHMSGLRRRRELPYQTAEQAAARHCRETNEKQLILKCCQLPAALFMTVTSNTVAQLMLYCDLRNHLTVKCSQSPSCAPAYTDNINKLKTKMFYEYVRDTSAQCNLSLCNFRNSWQFHSSFCDCKHNVILQSISSTQSYLAAARLEAAHDGVRPVVREADYVIQLEGLCCAV